MGPVDFSRLGPASGANLLLIGACGGIGMAVWRTAESLAANIIAMDLESSFARRRIELSESAIAVDLLNEASIRQAFAEFRKSGARLDGIVVCSGYTSGSDTIAELDTARFDEVTARATSRVR